MNFCSLAVDRIRPILQAGAARCIEDGRMSAETVEALRQSGLTELYRPSSCGGRDVKLSDYLRALSWMAAEDASTAWCLNIYNASTWLISGFFADETLSELFTGPTDGVIAGSMVVGGPCTTEKTADGYLLNGKWNFVSGCDYADWIFVKAPVPLSEAGASPEHLIALVPRADCDLGAEWSYSGLEGTGSKGIELHDVAVPARFATEFSDHLLECGVPSSRGRHFDFFRLPSRLIMRLPIAAVAIGVARRALELFEQNIDTKRPNGFTPRELPSFQLRLAESTMDVEHAEGLLFSIAEAGAERAAKRDEFPRLTRARYGRDLVEAVQLCTRAVDRMMAASGARAGFPSHPMQQAFRDMHAVAGHYSFDRDRAMSNYAKVRLGIELDGEVL